MIIDLSRGVRAAERFLDTLSSRPVCSEVTRVEVLQGVRSTERRNTERLLSTLTWVTVDERIARIAGEFGRTFRRSHAGIGMADLIVAATAEALSLPLATMNVKHFPMFKGLKAPYRI